ncbi:zinc finger FYVE domain-containing protein 9 isoform X2 [Diachasma alloeum]|uniref:zinc finger FYVE domain-containing protein 9 isoform X2 n=1 Tax=Diachasma alloeum TaxID=454923 RepID=UPI00073836AB|nr:zinc finger FYVE domain-containing protein 9 isoform X2 [Diachasma alloeum]
MEKFAVDLDKVLDDFEFNEDCAEQVASTAPEKVSHSDQRSKDPDLPRYEGKPIKNVDEEKPWHSRGLTTDTIDIRKSEGLHNNGESVNNFSPRSYKITDDKLQEKKVVDFRENDEPSTIHNDITQKLVLKKQNDNQTAKNHNSYDKKLNQPNIKPSVSNVFNSLNEYINASTTSMENISCSIDCQKERNGKFTINPETNDAQTSEAKRALRALPAYQNILLPMKCEPCAATQNPDTESDINDSTTTAGQHRKQGAVDCADHIYENVQFGKSMPASKTSRVQETSRSSSQDEAKHIYENVDFDQSTAGKDDSSIYACIYIGNKDMPETTTELEKAAKRLTEQFPENIVSAVEKKSSGRESESLVFQNVNLNTSERKPVGFSTIDDLSEEELNKYLAELEAEERAKEEAVIYENLSVPGPSSSAYHSLKEQARCISNKHADEDANEAPIFESVTIGELPRVSEQKLQEKAKKLRVIDYSKSGTSAESSNFLDQKTPEKFTDCDKGVADAKGKISNRTAVGSRLSVDEVVPENEQQIEKARNCTSQGKLSRISEAGDANNSDEKSGQQARDSCGTGDREAVGGSSGGSSEGGSRAEGEQSARDGGKSEDGSSSATIGGAEENGDKSLRPQTLDIVSSVSMDESSVIGSPETTANLPSNAATCTQEQNVPAIEESQEHLREPSPDVSDNSSMDFGIILGKQPPFWIPDGDAPNCMLCDVKFNVIKRRHHCRACGKVLCNKCCSMKYRLEYQGNMDSRVCALCYQQLIRAETEPGGGEWSSGFPNNVDGGINSPQGRQPNPNNPMEYCSTIPPLQQLAGNLPPPPTVMVPVGVLKREGSTKQRTEGQKSVMFSDELDTSWNPKPPYRKTSNKRIPSPGQQSATTAKRQNLPPLDPHTNSYIPGDTNMLPPTVTIHKGQINYQEVVDSAALYELLKNESEPPVMFAINRNLYAYVKMTNLNCCVNKQCWNVTSRGLACVGQDEVILLVEALPEETQLPKDLLIHINQIYVEAVKGNTVTELGVSIHQAGTLLGSREHAGFLFIRQTFQCLQKIVLPPPPFLVGLLVHRWETPWAKIFPLRLVLRLGAEYRYYPCPLVSVRFRNAVYFEIGHTIMKVLADFRNYAYTLPGVRGMVIHMQDRTTDVLFPRNRYDQVIKGLNNSNDHVLAFAANFSIHVDSHLVCIQTNTGDESNYQTQAINIHNKPRKITGASFVVINGALKSSMGLSAKSSIVEDGLMVQIMPEKMEALKAALKNMHDFTIDCGRQGVPEPDETVNIKWVDNDVQFNQGLKSPIDNRPMDGIPSIRVHSGNDYMGTSRFIRWTEVFIIKSDDHPNGVHDPVDLNKLSEGIARATCAALVKLLDLLAAAGLTKLAVRATIHPDNVGYEAGSEGTRLPPIYMNSLDNELIQVLHKAAQSSQDTNTVLELIFHVLDD